MTAIATWNEVTIDGIDYWVIDTSYFRIPKNWDPTSQIFFAVGVPSGGVGFFQAVAQGDPGVSPTIDTSINFTPIPPGDATLDYASFSVTGPNLYKLNLGLHTGQDGNDGAAVINVADYGTPIFKKILRVNSAQTSLEYQTQLVGDSAWPAVINNTPSGNAGFTLCSVSVPAGAVDFDWRPGIEGQCVITGTGSDLIVNLVARLNNETAGNIVGYSFGSSELSATTHVHPTHVLSSGPPAGVPESYNRVAAGAAATIYLRAERQFGAETFTTSNSTTRFKVKVEPIP